MQLANAQLTMADKKDRVRSMSADFCARNLRAQSASARVDARRRASRKYRRRNGNKLARYTRNVSGDDNQNDCNWRRD